MCVFLMPNLRTLKTFGPLYTAIKGKNVTHFQFLNLLGRLHYWLISICMFKKMSKRNVCVRKCCIVM